MATAAEKEANAAAEEATRQSVVIGQQRLQSELGRAAAAFVPRRLRAAGGTLAKYAIAGFLDDPAANLPPLPPVVTPPPAAPPPVAPPPAVPPATPPPPTSGGGGSASPPAPGGTGGGGASGGGTSGGGGGSPTQGVSLPPSQQSPLPVQQGQSSGDIYYGKGPSPASPDTSATRPIATPPPPGTQQGQASGDIYYGKGPSPASPDTGPLKPLPGSNAAAGVVQSGAATGDIQYTKPGTTPVQPGQAPAKKPQPATNPNLPSSAQDEGTAPKKKAPTKKKPQPKKNPNLPSKAQDEGTTTKKKKAAPKKAPTAPGTHMTAV